MAKESKREREQTPPAKTQRAPDMGKQVERPKQESRRKRNQVEAAKQESTGRRNQIQPAKREPTHKGNQVEAAKQDRRRNQVGAAKQESTREYKQVERAKAQERTREALIAAATDEFFEGNWLKTSLDSLSRRAGVTRQTLLRHFGSKDGLLMQSLMRGAAQVRDQRWSTPTADISGAVENIIDHYEEWGERSVRIGAWQRGPTVLALFANAARQIHYDWVEHAFAGWLDKFDDETRAERQAILVVLCDVQTWWILSNDLGLSRRKVHAILTDQIERTLEEK
jgi:AcrR family transcriptional regulator